MYYSGNRYLTGDEMIINARYVFEYLSANGWSENAICGVLGNMETESTINPAIWQSLTVNPLKGFGLVQWTPSTNYTLWCTANALDPSEMNSNLKRILYEVENNLQWGDDSLGGHPPYSFATFTKSKESAYDLGMKFLRYYERPLIYYQPSRGTQATAWFEMLAGKKESKSKLIFYMKRRRARQ